MKNRAVRKALEQVAVRHKVSVEEIMSEIEKAYAMSKGESSTDLVASAPEIVEKLSRAVIERLSV